MERLLKARGRRRLRGRREDDALAWAERRAEIAALERRPELASTQIVRLGLPADARRWLDGFAAVDERDSTRV